MQKKQLDNEKQQLLSENAGLRKQLVDQKKLVSENNALKDQFATTKPAAQQVLPARIIGAPGFIPGVSPPEKLIIDRGSRDGIVTGAVVVIKDNVIGTIAGVSHTIATVSLLTVSDTSFTAKTLETHAAGVVHGGAGGLALTNVTLSQKLKRGDVVLTKGDIDQQGKGFPPDLVVGKIVDIDKKASSLFQTAQIKSFIDVSALTTVFIVMPTK
jgi:rod shape-determining protein MreC